MGSPLKATHKKRKPRYSGTSSNAKARGIQPLDCPDCGRYEPLTRHEIGLIRGVLDDGTYTAQERKDIGTLCDMAINALLFSSEAEKVWRCRSCGVEQDSRGPVNTTSAIPRRPTEAMLDTQRCTYGCVKPCKDCDTRATDTWQEMYDASNVVGVTSDEQDAARWRKLRKFLRVEVTEDEHWEPVTETEKQRVSERIVEWQWTVDVHPDHSWRLYGSTKDKTAVPKSIDDIVDLIDDLPDGDSDAT